MEYHFVVTWSEENGWDIDFLKTITKFAEGKTVFIPNLKEWVAPISGSETGEKEQELINKLEEVFSQLNKEKR